MILVLVSAFLVLVVLMQRASSNSGMGSALGGGAAESALGGEAGNVLSRATIGGAVLFFVLAFALYLAHMASLDSKEAYGTGKAALPTLVAPEEEAQSAAAPAQKAIDTLTALPDEVVVDPNLVQTESTPAMPIPEAAATGEAEAE